MTYTAEILERDQLEYDAGRKTRVSRPILIVSAPRSGSTWLGRICGAADRVRLINEPFNPVMPLGLSLVGTPHWYEYVNGDSEQYQFFIQELLRFQRPTILDLVRIKGQSRWPWLRAMLTRPIWRLRGDRPIMKDPFASYSAEWLAKHCNMQVIVLIRHPAAYVASRMATGWKFDFREYLQQPKLMHDHMQPFQRQIQDLANDDCDPVRASAMEWLCVNHVLGMFARRHPDWLIVRHEDLCLNPKLRFGALFRELGLKFTGRVHRMIADTTTSEPDKYELHGIHRHSQSLPQRWKNVLTKSETDLVRDIVWPTSQQFYTEHDW